MALSLALANPAHAITILCLGDSLTEGFGVSKEAAWPTVAEKILRGKKHDVTFINAGISGSTTASAPSRMAWHLKSSTRIDLLFLALGANDGLRGQDVKAAQKSLERTIEMAKSGGIKKIILAGIKAPPSLGKAYTADFDSMFPRLAKKMHLIFYPFLLDGVAANPKYNLPDAVHPNVEGHKIMAEKIAQFIEAQL